MKEEDVRKAKQLGTFVPLSKFDKGQTCYKDTKPLPVHKDQHDKFVEELLADAPWRT